jgi:hypothetical protein
MLTGVYPWGAVEHKHIDPCRLSPTLRYWWVNQNQNYRHNLIGAEAREIVRGHRAAGASTAKTGVGLVECEEHDIVRVRDDSQISGTTLEALILASRPGLVKQRVRVIEKVCRATRLD